MRAQIERFVVVTCLLQNLAPTNGFNNIFSFDNFQQIISFVIIFDFSYNLAAGMPVCLPKIHQHSQQQKVVHCLDRHSRSGGVANISFGIPMLHGKHFVL